MLDFPTVDYLGVRLSKATVPDMIAMVASCVSQTRTLTVSYFGFHTANVIASNSELRATFDSLDLVVPDGIAILWTAWMFGLPLSVRNRMNGDILAGVLYEEGLKQGWSFYFLGSAPGVAAAAAERVKEAFPQIKIVGSHHGYLDPAKQGAIVDEINRASATIVLVGMGQPYQEQWIATNRNRLRSALLLGVGGYFDHVIRRIDCYPALIYRFRLNWAYRLILEPKRLWKRYTVGLMLFVWRILRARLSRI